MIYIKINRFIPPKIVGRDDVQYACQCGKILPEEVETNILVSDKTYDRGADGNKVVEEISLLCDPCVGRLLSAAEKFKLPIQDDRTLFKAQNLTAPGRLKEETERKEALRKAMIDDYASNA